MDLRKTFSSLTQTETSRFTYSSQDYDKIHILYIVGSLGLKNENVVGLISECTFNKANTGNISVKIQIFGLMPNSFK